MRCDEMSAADGGRTGAASSDLHRQIGRCRVVRIGADRRLFIAGVGVLPHLLRPGVARPLDRSCSSFSSSSAAFCARATGRLLASPPPFVFSRGERWSGEPENQKKNTFFSSSFPSLPFSLFLFQSLSLFTDLNLLSLSLSLSLWPVCRWPSWYLSPDEWPEVSPPPPPPPLPSSSSSNVPPSTDRLTDRTTNRPLPLDVCQPVLLRFRRLLVGQLARSRVKPGKRTHTQKETARPSETRWNPLTRLLEISYLSPPPSLKTNLTDYWIKL